MLANQKFGVRTRIKKAFGRIILPQNDSAISFL